MKTLLSLAFVLISSLTMLANGPVNYSATVVDQYTFVLKLDEVINADIQVKIADQRGYILYEEQLAQHSIDYRKYDLRNLPSGNYVLLVEFDNQIKVQPILKTRASLELDNNLAETVLMPSLNYDEGYMNANFFTEGAIAIGVKILDNEGNLVYAEDQQLASPFHKRYDLTQLPTGAYTFRIQINNGITKLNFTEQVYVEDAALAAN